MSADVLTWSASDASAFAATAVGDATLPVEKRPLSRCPPPASPYPMEALGPLREAAVAITERTQAPMAVAAQSVIAATTLAVQAHRDVLLPGSGRRPLTAIYITVAESGERKSSVDRLALAPVVEVETEWRRKAEAAMPAYLNEKTAWEAARDHAKRACRGDVAALRTALDAIGPAPKAPAHPMILVSDPTPEALTMHLVDRPSAGVFTAEGGMLVGGSAFNDEARMRTSALLNTLWDGEPIRRMRVGTGTSFLPGRRCSAHIMMQNVVAARLLGDRLFEDIGLMARVLMVAPESTAGTRMFREASGAAGAALERFYDRLRQLLTRPAAIRSDSPGALSPPPMELDVDARSAWIAFHDQCEQAIGTAGALAPVRAFGSKLAEHAGRLAATLTAYWDPDAAAVPLWAMQCGISLASHYANEMLRLQGGAMIPPELQVAEQLLTWWQAQPHGPMYLAMIYQRGPQSLRNAKAAKAAVQTLVQHGQVDLLGSPVVVDGMLRRQTWMLRQ